ncbi:hypothetical protein ACPF04_03510 [Campylobacter sp. MOP51]|uniref:hypothetical protein n=1 Tax=Campylobacter canis TaxID=3378588 RepID=UPI003C31ACC8
MLINTALSCNIQFWRSSNIVYYRVGRYGEKQKLDKDQMLVILGMDIEILKNTEQRISSFNQNIIVYNYLTNIKKEIFYPYSDDEWIETEYDFCYRNIFKHTSHILKRYKNQAQQMMPYGYQMILHNHQAATHQTLPVSQVTQYPIQQQSIKPLPICQQLFNNTYGYKLLPLWFYS